MPESTEALVRDLVEWIAAKPRTHAEVMEAWRTSCPRLTIWEDALDRGLVSREGHVVTITDEGLVFLGRYATKAAVA